MWTSDDITIEIEDVQGSMMLVRIETPAGVILLLGRVTMRDGILTVDESHVQGLSPGAIGRSGLNAIGRKMLEVADARALIVQGSTRTTGANPGSRPSPIRYPRQRLPDSP